MNKNNVLRQKISEDLKEAMKSRDELRTSALRMLTAAIHNKEITLLKKDTGLADDEILQVIRTEIKKRKEAAGEFERGGRMEMAGKEAQEAVILEAYVPAELSDEELFHLVDNKVRELGASSEKEFGVVMKAVMTVLDGRASGERVSNAVKKALRGTSHH